MLNLFLTIKEESLITKMKTKELTTLFLVLDGELKMENHIGSSEILGENIGEKWDTSESPWEIIN
jgi:hypothetical protein